jgi:hypothetical protein
MGLDPESRALEFILTIDLTIDELRRIQSMFQSIEFEKVDNIESDFNWYSLLKKMLETQCNFILENAEPLEIENLPN